MSSPQPSPPGVLVRPNDGSSPKMPPRVRCVSAVVVGDEDGAVIPPDSTTATVAVRKIEDDYDDEEDEAGRTFGDNDNDANPDEGEDEDEDEDDQDEDEEDDEYEYEYEDDDEAAYSGFLVPTAAASSSSANLVVAESKEEEQQQQQPAAPRIVETDEEQRQPRKKWREPSRAAVSMSLRAQQETTGSKRRLAQDLYRIMNQDTVEAGFSLTPQSEDSMDKWCIKLFQFDEDSNLAKDMVVLNIDSIELEMSFPDQYPFAPPFVRVVRPRFKRQTGFVMAGALCMELLTSEGWNPINDIESVIVSVRSLLVVGDGRLQAAADLPKPKYEALLNAKSSSETTVFKRRKTDEQHQQPPPKDVGAYTANEAKAAYSHLSDYHKKKGWDNSGWWARKG